MRIADRRLPIADSQASMKRLFGVNRRFAFLGRLRSASAPFPNNVYNRDSHEWHCRGFSACHGVYGVRWMCVAVPYRARRDREYPCEGPKKRGNPACRLTPFPNMRRRYKQAVEVTSVAVVRGPNQDCGSIPKPSPEGKRRVLLSSLTGTPGRRLGLGSMVPPPGSLRE